MVLGTELGQDFKRKIIKHEYRMLNDIIERYIYCDMILIKRQFSFVMFDKKNDIFFPNT